MLFFFTKKQLLPASLNLNDTNILTASIKDRLKSSQNLETLLLKDTYLVTISFLNILNQKFQTSMEEKANDDLRRPNYVLAIKSENAVAGGISSNLGATIPLTSSKSKGKSKIKETMIEEEGVISPLEIQFLDRSGLLKQLKSDLKDAENDLIESLAEHLLRY